MMTSRHYVENVFINCPFDDQYLNIRNAITKRSATQVENSRRSCANVSELIEKRNYNNGHIRVRFISPTFYFILDKLLN